ncbi:putative eukaryotic translation initiation factor 3 subunit G [Tribonema minus]|uniref:Eukaryotic translation initiation factor 3 subunit G n=1 Tax=Tribonema minus TaxID=303371 RepID=A0A835YJN9_9STRA|nr:putative eukaryotic translation initiation factor 3 subunit G [Tribonema minus]
MRGNWGDEDDDPDYLPPRQESGVDGKGIKTVVEWAFNDAGQKTKTTTKVKVFAEQQRISRAVAERKKWKVFGAAAEVSDNHSYTLTSQEQVMMETPRESKEADEQPSNVSDSLKEAMERVRRRNAMRQMGMLGDGEAAPTDDEPGGGLRGGGGAEGGKYIPPGARWAAAAGGAGGGDAPPMPLEDRTKIRVTNISEDTTEGDLRELFGTFGRIHRVYLAKDPETMQSRGFAFVSFTSEADAERAMNKLQGYGYDHLILKLEFAKPSQRDAAGGGGGGGPGGGGLSSARVSGYGQALAQDTKERVSFASNLTR